MRDVRSAPGPAVGETVHEKLSEFRGEKHPDKVATTESSARSDQCCEGVRGSVEQFQCKRSLDFAKTSISVSSGNPL